MAQLCQKCAATGKSGRVSGKLTTLDQNRMIEAPVQTDTFADVDARHLPSLLNQPLHLRIVVNPVTDYSE